MSPWACQPTGVRRRLVGPTLRPRRAASRCGSGSVYRNASLIETNLDRPSSTIWLTPTLLTTRIQAPNLSVVVARFNGRSEAAPTPGFRQNDVVMTAKFACASSNYPTAQKLVTTSLECRDGFVCETLIS